MKRYIKLILFLVLAQSVSAQTTINTYTVWGTPGSTAVHSPSGDLIVNDTLIIYGTLRLDNGEDLTINAGGVLVVVGDFDAKNKVNLNSGGVLVVTGDFDKNGSQGTIIDNDGSMYLFDDTPEWGSGPNPTPGVDYGDEDEIINDPIIDVIGDIISSGCELSLTLDNITDVTTPEGSNGAISITVTGTINSYNWSQSNGGSGIDNADEDYQTGLTSGTYSVAVTGTNGGATCSVFGTYTVSEVSCTPPTITSTTEASRCGTGTVNLSASASAGTISWYDVATGGTSIGTGTNFSTPSISSTTSYYVDATDAGCTTATRTEVVATVNPLPVATIAFTAGNGVICDGDDTELEVTATGASPFDITVGNNRNAFTSSVVGTTSPWTFTPDKPVWIPADGATSTYTYTITTITDNNGCTSNNVDNVDVEVYKVPETGPQYHIDNTWGN